jgi:hypothetical protein
MSIERVAEIILNGKAEILTSYGYKNKAGIVDMIKRHKIVAPASRRCCDTCAGDMSARAYKKNKGLCKYCIGQIN